jgi:hypothetical protein
LHETGAGLKEFDLIIEQRCTLAEIDSATIKELSREQILVFNDCAFESLKPGEVHTIYVRQ